MSAVVRLFSAVMLAASLMLTAALVATIKAPVPSNRIIAGK
jgi:hypothetical protein